VLQTPAKPGLVALWRRAVLLACGSLKAVFRYSFYPILGRATTLHPTHASWEM